MWRKKGEAGSSNPQGYLPVFFRKVKQPPRYSSGIWKEWDFKVGSYCDDFNEQQRQKKEPQN